MKKWAVKIIHLLFAVCLIAAGILSNPATANADIDMNRKPGMFEPDGEFFMNPGDMINLRYPVYDDGYGRLITEQFEWSSSDTAIISLELFEENKLDIFVKLRALSEGTANIIAKDADGSILTMKVTVKDTSPQLTIPARATSVRYASKWRTLIGVDGTYESVPKEKILKRINEIRYEACKKGYPVPDNEEKELTLDDYVPIRWSSDLEWISQIRAAESTVRQEHDRPNGRSCFSVTHNGIMPTGECLAWNNSGILEGIEQWYEEKDDWIKQDTKKETGHYTAMINPEIAYVGMSGFVKKSGGWHGIAGEFVTKADTVRSVFNDLKETVFVDNYSDRDEKYYDLSIYNDGGDTDFPYFFLSLPLIPDNPDGMDSLEDLERLYGIKSFEEYRTLANAGTLDLNLPEEQLGLEGHTIQMMEVISTRLGKAAIDAPKSIKKGKKKQIFVTRTAYDIPAVVLDAKWNSSNESILSIQEDGTMTALKPGTVTVTAQFGENILKKTVRVK